MDLFKELASLDEMLEEAMTDQKISEIKGFGKHWFYLVSDPRPETKKTMITLGDVIAKVKLEAIINIGVGAGGTAKYKLEHPELYPEDQKDKAIADAMARIDKLS